MTDKELKKLKDNLWHVADVLRAGAHLAANKYGQPILGLIFLRYADILFKQHKVEINAEFEKYKGTRMEKSLKEIAIEKCGFFLPECAYYEEGSQPFLEYVAASYISNAQRSLAETARTERICKIAVYDGKGPENNGMKALPAALPDLRVIQSGGNWLDISARDTDKGNALRFLLKKLDVAREECAAFGDHMNDYEMLLECGHPYVPANAYPPLLEKIGTVVSSNAENGVLREMERIAEQN